MVQCPHTRRLHAVAAACSGYISDQRHVADEPGRIVGGQSQKRRAASWSVLHVTNTDIDWCCDLVAGVRSVRYLKMRRIRSDYGIGIHKEG